MQEIQVRTLGREDPLEEGMTARSSILCAIRLFNFFLLPWP